MTIELDHIFICCSADGTEAACLAAFGLTEGTPNVHPGQGTACRRFVFSNLYLELLWVRDASEAQSGRSRPLHLWDRWTQRGSQASPFGLGFRPGASHNATPPFATWEYHPSYLPDSQCIRVGKNSEVLTEPMLFFLPFAARRNNQSKPRLQPANHTVGIREVTFVELVTPCAGNLSPELQSLKSTGLLSVTEGPGHLIALGFDGQKKGAHADFHPSLPLTFEW